MHKRYNSMSSILGICEEKRISVEDYNLINVKKDRECRAIVFDLENYTEAFNKVTNNIYHLKRIDEIIKISKNIDNNTFKLIDRSIDSHYKVLGIKPLSYSLESFNDRRSYLNKKISVSLEGFFDFIKKIWKFICDQITKFWNWITGKKSSNTSAMEQKKKEIKAVIKEDKNAKVMMSPSSKAEGDILIQKMAARNQILSSKNPEKEDPKTVAENVSNLSILNPDHVKETIDKTQKVKDQVNEDLKNIKDEEDKVIEAIATTENNTTSEIEDNLTSNNVNEKTIEIATSTPAEVNERNESIKETIAKTDEIIEQNARSKQEKQEEEIVNISQNPSEEVTSITSNKDVGELYTDAVKFMKVLEYLSNPTLYYKTKEGDILGPKRTGPGLNFNMTLSDSLNAIKWKSLYPDLPAWKDVSALNSIYHNQYKDLVEDFTKKHWRKNDTSTFIKQNQCQSYYLNLLNYEKNWINNFLTLATQTEKMISLSLSNNIVYVADIGAILNTAVNHRMSDYHELKKQGKTIGLWKPDTTGLSLDDRLRPYREGDTETRRDSLMKDKKLNKDFLQVINKYASEINGKY